MQIIHRYKNVRAAQSFNDRWMYLMPGTVQVGYTISEVVGPASSVVTLHGVITKGVQYEAWLTTPQGILVYESIEDIASFTIAVGGPRPNYQYIVCRVIWSHAEALAGNYLVIDVGDYNRDTDTIIALVYQNVASVDVYQHTPNSRNWVLRLLNDPTGVKQIASFDLEHTSLADTGTTTVKASIQEPYGARRYSLQSSLVQWLRLNAWLQLPVAIAGNISLYYSLSKLKHNVAAVTVTGSVAVPCTPIVVAPFVVKAADDIDISDLYNAAEYDQDAVWKLEVSRIGSDPADDYPLAATALCAGIEYVMRQPGELF